MNSTFNHRFITNSYILLTFVLIQIDQIVYILMSDSVFMASDPGEDR